MKELITLAAYESFFIFDQVIYIQIDDVAMGSPMGPILMNSFLYHFERLWLPEYAPDILPKSLKDILMIFF